MQEEKLVKFEKKIEEYKNKPKAGYVDQAARYKIHLQVKQEYLFEFVSKLLIELEKPELHSICQFKFTLLFQEKIYAMRHMARSKGGKAIPIIVLYVAENVDFLDNEKRNNIIDPMILELGKFVDDFCNQHKPAITIQNLAWSVTPRFNKKINDVVYIAGGDGDYKPVPSEEDEIVFLKTGIYKYTGGYIPYIGDAEYSDDLCFVRGHEYFTPEERKLHVPLIKLKKSLEALKGKMLTLKATLELLNKKLQHPIS